jgi:hypothetical protein
VELIADILLAAGALGAGFYCFVLARRLNRFNDLEKGVGGAVAVLSAQVDDLTKTLDAARNASEDSDNSLEELTVRAESVAQRLELIMASMHDMPATAVSAPPEKSEEPTPEVKDVVPETLVPDVPPSQPQGLMFRRHDRTHAGAV